MAKMHSFAVTTPSRPNGEAFEIRKPSLALLDPEKITEEAVSKDHGRMGAAAKFPHPCEDAVCMADMVATAVDPTR